MNEPVKRVLLPSIWVKFETLQWIRDTRENYSVNGRVEQLLDEASTAGAPRLCACGCGRRFFGSAKRLTASVACRKRLQRQKLQKSHSTVTFEEMYGGSK